MGGESGLSLRIFTHVFFNGSTMSSFITPVSTFSEARAADVWAARNFSSAPAVLTGRAEPGACWTPDAGFSSPACSDEAAGAATASGVGLARGGTGSKREALVVYQP